MATVNRKFDVSLSRYSNSVLVSTSPWETRLTFGESKRIEAGPDLEESYYAEIVLSPQHLKLLVHLLQHHVANYEKTFGTIPTIPSDAPKSIH